MANDIPIDDNLTPHSSEEPVDINLKNALIKDDQVIVKGGQVNLKSKTNNKLPANGQIINSEADIVIPRTEQDWRDFTEEERFKHNQKKNALMNHELTLPKETILCCPSCRYRITIYHNYRLNGYFCYNCGNKNFKPITRKKEYFRDIIGSKKKRDLKFDAQGNKIITMVDNPIRRFHRRGFADRDVMTRQQILTILNEKYEDAYNLRPIDVRNAALLACLFETGCRIEELVGVPKYAIGSDGKQHSIKDKYEVEPVKRNQISIETINVDGKDVDFFCARRLPVLKRRESKTIDKETSTLVRAMVQRNVIVPVNMEKDFIFFINRYLQHINIPEQFLFPMRASNAYKIVYRYFGRKYCHIFRHWRASDLASSIYNLNSIQMKHFFGWASETQAQKYIHLQDTDLMKSMLRQSQK